MSSEDIRRKASLKDKLEMLHTKPRKVEKIGKNKRRFKITADAVRTISIVNEAKNKGFTLVKVVRKGMLDEIEVWYQ